MAEEVKTPLLDETLKGWVGKKVAVSVNSDHIFTGVLKEFDEEILILEDVIDIAGNKGKALIVKIDDMNWLMLLE